MAVTQLLSLNMESNSSFCEWGRSPSTVETVIFDIDGTIVDSVDLHARAWQRAFAKFGKNILFEAIRSQIGKGADQLLPVYFSEQELEQFGEAMEIYRGELFKSEYLPKVKGFPKVRELFEQIRRGKKRIALASSAKEDELKHYKEIAQINDLIDGETSSDDVERSKPCPDIFEVALKRLGNITSDKVIVVGDTPYDAVAAAKANIRIHWPFVWRLDTTSTPTSGLHCSLPRPGGSAGTLQRIALA